MNFASLFLSSIISLSSFTPGNQTSAIESHVSYSGIGPVNLMKNAPALRRFVWAKDGAKWEIYLLSSDGSTTVGDAILTVVTLPNQKIDTELVLPDTLPVGDGTTMPISKFWLMVRYIPPFTGMRGDLNNDGKITISDAVILMNMVTGKRVSTVEDRQKGDMNLDGILTVADATKMIRILIGLN